MELPINTSAKTWLDRLSLVTALTLCTTGALSVAGWIMGWDAAIQPFSAHAPVRINSAVCYTLLGIVLVLREIANRRWAFLALVPVAMGAATLVQICLQLDLGIDEFILRDHLSIDTDHPGRMAPLSAVCLVLGGTVLAWHAVPRGNRTRQLVGAITGSLIAAIGFSTLLGYAVSLRAAYFWGTGIAVSPISAISLMLAGIGIFLLSWRESVKDAAGAPAWAPLPVVVGCLTLTIIFGIGLREKERSVISEKTQAAIEVFSNTIDRELDDQKNHLERLARRWGDGPGNSQAEWEIDAKALLEQSGRMGAVSVTLLDPTYRNRWAYPAGHSAPDFDQGSVPERFAALQSTIARREPVISDSTQVTSKDGHTENGLVLYAPVMRAGSPAGFVAEEFGYATLFRNLIGLQASLANDYHITVSIGGTKVYNSNAGSPPVPEFSSEQSYALFERQLRLEFTPTRKALLQNSRSLPEIALATGLGITVLLGLSAHLARSARAGQRAAELSNKKLIGENEERRRVEARLKVSDERLRLALDSTQIGIFEWSVPAGSVYYSQGLWAMLGYEQSQMTATVEAWQSLIHPDDLPLYRRRTDSQLNGIASFIDPEYRVRTRSGEWRWVYTRSKSVAHGPNGRPIRIIGTVQDITARREAEQALRESQAEARKLSLVASRTDNPVLICSPEGKIEWVNEAFCRVMEYSLEEVAGRSPAHLMEGPEIDRTQVEQIHQAIAAGNGLSTDIVNYSKSGRKYYLHLEIQPVRRATGELENFIAIETDITARVETEQQLRRAKGEADAASRAKSEFLASMSHEIRTPMNGVIGMTSLLMNTPLNPEQRDFVHTIRNSGEALLTIINDILDFSKIESGKMELESRPLDLTLCLEESLDLFAVQASAKKLDLTYHLAPDVPAWIKGDITRLRQVLVNLVNNAIKFTPGGSISITVDRSATPVEDGAALLQFSVRDTGIGIPADRITRLFRAFSQVDSSTTRKYGGTGLGLAICQRLCQLMGGDIRVESTVGEGSAFIFTIKTQAIPAPAESALPPLPEALRRGDVVCVEDHPVTQARLRSFFSHWGATCHIVPEPAAAEALIARLAKPPMLLVLDGGDGGTNAPLRILPAVKCARLVMFPFGQSAPINDSDAVLFAPLSKPLKQAALIQAVLALFSTADAIVVPKAAVAERLLADEFPLDVLLAEDNPVNQKVALRFLERLGYRADAVGNGLEAVTTLENRRYDVVFMDLQMPEMDGLEASREIRRRFPADRQPKIIALTANAMQGDRELCLDAGMDDYITKPVKLAEIVAAIRRQFTPASRAPFATEQLRRSA